MAPSLMLLLLLGAATPTAAQQRVERGTSPVTIVLIAGAAQHTLTDWRAGMDALAARARARGLSPEEDEGPGWFAGGKLLIRLSERVDGELSLERLGGSSGFLVDDEVGGSLGSERATFSYEVEVRGPVIRGGLRYGLWRGPSARAYAAAGVGLGFLDVRFEGPGAAASGGGSGPAVAAAIGVDKRAGRLRPLAEIGYRFVEASTEYTYQQVLGGSQARHVFEGGNDLRDFLQDRTAQLSGPYLLVGLGFSP